MIITLLCIFFANDLTLYHLTLQALFKWYCNHPLLFMIAVSELMGHFNLIKINFKRSE